jgi:hypothetical protein
VKALARSARRYATTVGCGGTCAFRGKADIGMFWLA